MSEFEKLAAEIENLNDVIESVKGDRGILRVSGTRGDPQDVGILGIARFSDLARRLSTALRSVAPARLWPKVFNVKRAQNTWNGEIAFAREPTDDELKAIEIHLRDDHRPAPTAAEFDGPTLTEEVAALRKVVAESGGLAPGVDERSAASTVEPEPDDELSDLIARKSAEIQERNPGIAQWGYRKPGDLSTDLTTLCDAVMADVKEAKRRLDADIPIDAPVHPVSAFLTGIAIHVGKARAAIPAAPTTSPEPCPRPFNDDPQDLSADECVRLGHCGCGHVVASPEPEAVRERLRNAIDSPVVQELARVFSRSQSIIDKSYGEQIVDILAPALERAALSAPVAGEASLQNTTQEKT